MTATLFDEIGADRLRAVLRTFYDSVFDDVLIGFLFRGKDKERLIEKEWELVAKELGAKVEYTGRPLEAVHAPHRILGGQFERRLRLLEQAMDHHRVSPAVREAWIAHTRALRPLVTKDTGTECEGG